MVYTSFAIQYTKKLKGDCTSVHKFGNVKYRFNKISQSLEQTNKAMELVPDSVSSSIKKAEGEIRV